MAGCDPALVPAAGGGNLLPYLVKKKDWSLDNGIMCSRPKGSLVAYFSHIATLEHDCEKL